MEAIIVLPNDTIIAGHRRTRIAKELGIEKVDCRIILSDISEEEERKLVIKNNLLRRQLGGQEERLLYTYLGREGRHEIILEKYGKEKILEEKRGKSSDGELPLEKQIVKDLGGSPRTAQTDIAELRRKVKGADPTAKKKAPAKKLPTKGKMAFYVQLVSSKSEESIEKSYQLSNKMRIGKTAIFSGNCPICKKKHPGEHHLHKGEGVNQYYVICPNSSSSSIYLSFA